MKYDEYESLIDKFNLRMSDTHKRPKWTGSFVAVLALSIVYLALVVSSHEEQVLMTIPVPAMITGIGCMIYLETYIGDQYRGTVQELFTVFHYDSAKQVWFRRVFNNKLRTVFGILLSALTAGACFSFFVGALWYDSPLIKAYFLALAMLLSFILGEAAVGALALITYIDRTSNELKGVDIFRPAHLKPLKSLAHLGLYLSFFGSIVDSALLLAFFLAPWKAALLVISQYGTLFLVASSVLLLSVFFIPALSIHDLMKEAKEEKISNLTQLGRLYEQFREVLEIRDVDKVSEKMDSYAKIIDGMNKMKEELTESIPDWPWDMQILHSLAGSIALPLIIYAAQKAVDKLFRG